MTGRIPAEVRVRVLAEHHARLADRRLAAARTRVLCGVYPARVPFGYQVTDTPYGSTPGVDTVGMVAPPYQWERDDASAAVVRLIYRLCLDGHSDARITTALTALSGVPRPVDPRTGNPREFSPAIIAAILTNPAYTGHQVWGRTHHGRRVPPTGWTRCPVPSHPLLISHATYDAVQHHRAHRRARPQPGRAHPGPTPR